MIPGRSGGATAPGPAGRAGPRPEPVALPYNGVHSRVRVARPRSMSMRSFVPALGLLVTVGLLVMSGVALGQQDAQKISVYKSPT